MRTAAVLALVPVLAGCGGSGAARPAAERPALTGGAIGDEFRSPDARSPFVPGSGAWRCETAGSVELRISAEGQATLTLGGRTLASVSPGRALVNRACERRRPEPAPPIGAPREVLGAASLRCRTPSFVVVDFRGGDLTLRAAGDGRFLAGAAVSAHHLGVAGYWDAGCAPS